MRHEGKRRTRWTEDEAQSRLVAWRESGLGLKEFAQREGLRYERLRRWHARKPRVAADFAAVQIVTPPQSQQREPMPITIELGCGIRLHVSECVDALAVVRLAQALEHGRC
jgi:hypothetical protein